MQWLHPQSRLHSGLDTPQGEAAMSKRLRTALALTQDCLLRCGNDCELLTGCIKETEKGVAVIAGKLLPRSTPAQLERCACRRELTDPVDV